MTQPDISSLHPDACGVPRWSELKNVLINVQENNSSNNNDDAATASKAKSILDLFGKPAARDNKQSGIDGRKSKKV